VITDQGLCRSVKSRFSRMAVHKKSGLKYRSRNKSIGGYHQAVDQRDSYHRKGSDPWDVKEDSSLMVFP
jgi:hypothetical protein